MSDKMSRKSPTKRLLLGIPPNIAAGLLGFRAELDIKPRGERAISDLDRRGDVDQADSTAILDRSSVRPSRIVSNRRKSEARGSLARTIAVAIDHTEPVNHPRGV